MKKLFSFHNPFLTIILSVLILLISSIFIFGLFILDFYNITSKADDLLGLFVFLGVLYGYIGVFFLSTLVYIFQIMYFRIHNRKMFWVWMIHIIISLLGLYLSMYYVGPTLRAMGI